MGMKQDQDEVGIEWLSIKKDKDRYSDWVCDMHNFLKDLGLKHYCEYDKIGILNVKDDLKETVLSKCIELGVLFHIYCRQTAIYEGYHRGERELLGFVGDGVDFFIECVPKGVDNSKIYYTFERKM